MKSMKTAFMAVAVTVLCGIGFSGDYSQRRAENRIDWTNPLSRHIVDADCSYAGGKFTLKGLPADLPGLFTVRFTAPEEYSAGDVVVAAGRELPVRTAELQAMPAGVFAQGAVVQCDIDLEQEICFLRGSGGNGGGGGVAFAMVPDYANMETVNQIPTINGTWTVDRDGFVSVSAWSNNVATYDQRLYINERAALIEEGRTQAILPVVKGDVLRFMGDFTQGNYCYYVPPKYIPINQSYSTDEQLTGETWIDGKPIWKKVFTDTNTSVNKLIGTLPTGTVVVDFKGAIIDSLGNRYVLPYMMSTTNYMSIQVNPANEVRIHQSTSWNGTKVDAIIYYTKP